ncbi:MAG: tetratricopeptide repeat protein, partial [Bacteroidales bacterium]|nr:tetratricopeptide repeat protein [Bacteroidales bacterium]
QIISDYGAKAGKSVYFYAGVCELQIGNYDEAITYLKKYKGKDHILLGRAQSCIGDSYVALEDYSTAVGWFVKAARTSSDIYSAGYLLKAGVTSEELGNLDEALSYYNEIKLKYPQSVEGYDIDKYISRIEVQKH